MNIRALLLVTHITGYAIFPEGHIADSKVKRTICIGSTLKRLIGNGRIRIDMSCNSGCDGVKLHAMNIATLPDAFRHIFQKSAVAARRLQDITPSKATLCQALINSLNKLWRREMGVERGSPGRAVLGIREIIPQLIVFLLPSGIISVKGFRQAAEARKAFEYLQFFRRGLPFFVLQPFYRANSCHIALKDLALTGSGRHICRKI